jgi:molecular chaperone GrpE
MTEPHEGSVGPVFRDKRRIDPDTFEVRVPPAAQEPVDDDEPLDDGVGHDLVELTADLQRLSAEYANYRRRVERDRTAVRESAVAGVVSELLPILDDIGRAREHGELEGAFRAVGESLEQTVTRLGVERYAESGEAFDPTLHEALTAVPSPDVEHPTVHEVYQPGYRYAGRVIRAARVVVAQPEAAADLPAHP